MIHQVKAYWQRRRVHDRVEREIAAGFNPRDVLARQRVSDLRRLCTFHNVLCGRGRKLDRVEALLPIYARRRVAAGAFCS